MPASIAERWLPAGRRGRRPWSRSRSPTAATSRPRGAGPRSSRCSPRPRRSRCATASRLERLDALWLGALVALAAWIGLSALWAPAVETPLLELERTLVSVAVVLALLLLCDRRAVPALLGGTLGRDHGRRRVLARDEARAGPARRVRLRGRLPARRADRLLERARPARDARCPARARLRSGREQPRAARSGGRAAPRARVHALLHLRPRRLARARRRAVRAPPRSIRSGCGSAGLGLALAPAPALAVWLCSRPDALNAPGAALDAAAREGRRLALVIVALTAVEAGIALAAPRLRVGRRVRIAVAAVLGVVVLAGLVAALARVGSPVAAFRTPVPATDADLGRRLFSASGNGRSDYWRIALEQAADEPLLGGGAGSYERRWLRDRPTAFSARDAHSVYLETLAELGPLGLGLLLAALGIPLVALARARRDPLAVTAGSAYAAFLVHAALDWDWEVPAVTVPALGLAGAVVLTARRGTSRPLGPRLADRRARRDRRGDRLRLRPARGHRRRSPRARRRSSAATSSRPPPTRGPRAAGFPGLPSRGSGWPRRRSRPDGRRRRARATARRSSAPRRAGSSGSGSRRRRTAPPARARSLVRWS